jgi:hypothetical protein
MGIRKANWEAAYCTEWVGIVRRICLILYTLTRAERSLALDKALVVVTGRNNYVVSEVFRLSVYQSINLVKSPGNIIHMRKHM